MIRCTPEGFCSWNYRLSGAGHSGRAEFNWIGEEGRLTLDNLIFEVVRHGVFSGRWTLQERGHVLIAAQKSSAFTRTFDLTWTGGAAVLSAQSVLGRTMLIEGPEVSCTIAPVHPLTYRASISGQWKDFRPVAFAFWLAVIIWRRDAESG